jgi:hypothetical protein
VVGAILVCSVMASLCWIALWDCLWGTRLRPALKTSDGGCFNVPEYIYTYICVVVVFGDDIWGVSFVGF